MVGETHNLQALNPSGQPVTGLTWNSSDSTVASLSTDDPPILTAVAPGHVTITAGTASADVTVWASSLPMGTVIWSNPGDGSGVLGIEPAVPSASGVADVFAFQGDGSVQAITSSGTTAWSADATSVTNAVPDFQGGLVLTKGTAMSIQKLDGITGHAYPAYTIADEVWFPGYELLAIHTDGTVFAVDTPWWYSYPTRPISVIGVDPTTGTQKFSVALDESTFNGQPSAALVLTHPMIAGDGYAYLAYQYWVETQTETHSDNGGSETGDTVSHLMLLRVGSDGSSQKIDVKDWEQQLQSSWVTSGGLFVSIQTVITGANVGIPQAQLITNADQGVALSWEADSSAYCASANINGCIQPVPASSTFGLGTTSGGSLASSTTVNVPSQASVITPVLQAQDGTFIGTVGIGPSPGTITQTNMIALDSSGNVKWSVPNDSPEIATANGGVIAVSGVTYDSNGNATGQTANMLLQSWIGNGYTSGVNQVASTPPDYAASFAAIQGGNPSAASPAPQSQSAAAPSSGPYVVQETMFVRSFAPWQWFGAEGIYPLCSNNCFLGDDRSFTTSSAATSRITGIFKFWQSGAGTAVRGPSWAFSDPSYDIWGNTRTANPKISTSYGPNGYTFHMEFAGSNPLIFPQTASPDINTKLDFTPAWTAGQICYSGHLYGDAFPTLRCSPRILSPSGRYCRPSQRRAIRTRGRSTT